MFKKAGDKLTQNEQEKMLKDIISNSKPFYKRNLKAYSNFHFNSNRSKDRSDAINKIPKDLVYYEPNMITRKESWEKQIKFAFVISPHGRGFDCHRTWEALILGCIPIVKTSILDTLYDNLPVLIVKDWSDVTYDLLNETVYMFKNKKFNYNKLSLKYWKNIINTTNNKNDY